jgi:glycerol-3-phosphate acyltransferase PlsY
MIVHAWRILLVAYLLGSIPSAYIVSQFLVGKDIRELGNGNMGAKNTYHSVGLLAGLLVAVADITKGALAIKIAQSAQVSYESVLAAGVCVVLGHDFPIFARFRDGQGMATVVGVFGMLFPREMILALCILGLVLAFSRNWNLSCAAAFISLLGLMWVMGQPPRRLIYPFVLLPTIGIRKLMQKWQAHREVPDSGLQ